MKQRNDGSGPRSIPIEPAALEEILAAAYELVIVHSGCPLRGDSAPPEAPTPEGEAAARLRARWANASPAVRATAVFLLVINDPGCHPVQTLGVPVAVEPLSPDAAALVLVKTGNWRMLDFDRATAAMNLAAYHPALRRAGQNPATITLKRLDRARRALRRPPKGSLAERLRAVKELGMTSTFQWIWGTSEVPPGSILADAAKLHRTLVAQHDAVRAAFREGVLAAVKGARETTYARVAVDIACAVVLGSVVPSGHDRLEIEAAVDDML